MTDQNPLARRFPKDFLFGVATAAYQIEGATRADGRGPSIWDAFANMPGRVHQMHNGDVACDHYNRWESDLDLIKEMNADAYRFSIAWPRILPQGKGQVNEAGLDFYDRLIDGMVERGLKVFPTLYHWDLPLALAGYGGWTDRDTADAFAEYTSIVVRRLGDRMDALATINEPWCATYLSHLYGIHAPGEKSLEAALAAVHVMNLAHGKAVQAARAERSDLPMGTVINAVSIYPASESPEDVAAAERAFQFNNGAFFGPILNGHYDAEFQDALGHHLKIKDGDLDIIHQPLDWWGFNYYTPTTVKHDPDTDAVFPAVTQVETTNTGLRTDIGWEIQATGITHLLHQVYDRYPNLPPVYITENGACYNTEVGPDGTVADQERLDYVNDHLHALADGVDAGLPIQGYFAWSLMDNYEWAEGYAMRFGMVHVNYDTQVRTVKNSGKWYAKLAESHRHRNSN